MSCEFATRVMPAGCPPTAMADGSASSDFWSNGVGAREVTCQFPFSRKMAISCANSIDSTSSRAYMISTGAFGTSTSALTKASRFRRLGTSWDLKFSVSSRTFAASFSRAAARSLASAACAPACATSRRKNPSFTLPIQTKRTVANTPTIKLTMNAMFARPYSRDANSNDGHTFPPWLGFLAIGLVFTAGCVKSGIIT
jgi:hypothetical protein